MGDPANLNKVKEYFIGRLNAHGASHQAVDYNSPEAQEARFFQLTKVVDAGRKYSLLDFGSGYGALYDYLIRNGQQLRYVGYDIAEPMVMKGREIHPDNPDCLFMSNLNEVPVMDYAMLSGTFNMKLDANYDAWTRIVLDSLHQMNERASLGMSFNMLTKYSDADKMRPDLYYADPCYYFDYCKRYFSRNVALLHDYDLYDFTILVRKA